MSWQQDLIITWLSTVASSSNFTRWMMHILYANIHFSITAPPTGTLWGAWKFNYKHGSFYNQNTFRSCGKKKNSGKICFENTCFLAKNFVWWTSSFFFAVICGTNCVFCSVWCKSSSSATHVWSECFRSEHLHVSVRHVVSILWVCCFMLFFFCSDVKLNAAPQGRQERQDTFKKKSFTWKQVERWMRERSVVDSSDRSGCIPPSASILLSSSAFMRFLRLPPPCFHSSFPLRLPCCS